MPTPEQTVQATVDAYNAHDLDAYLALFAPEATFGQLGGRTLLEGREAMRGFYTQMFAARPDIRCRSVERAAMGPFVMDRQEISGEGRPPMEAVMIHEVRDGLVAHIWYAPLVDARIERVVRAKRNRRGHIQYNTDFQAGFRCYTQAPPRLVTASNLLVWFPLAPCAGPRSYAPDGPSSMKTLRSGLKETRKRPK